ncbi:MAG TPA: cyclase family protein, partial [Acidobacteriota bacterium]|nr:cyclase family protein [Acidobacteriota bacterium]
MRIYDISPALSSQTACWPGDTPFEQWKVQSFSEGDAINLGSIRLSLHTGSHMDAPCHYLKDGATIDQIPLERCIGPARLVTLTGEVTISASRLERLHVLQEGCPERLLIRLC